MLPSSEDVLGVHSQVPLHSRLLVTGHAMLAPGLQVPDGGKSAKVFSGHIVHVSPSLQ